jgi:hypothetical protein
VLEVIEGGEQDPRLHFLRIQDDFFFFFFPRGGGLAPTVCVHVIIIMSDADYYCVSFTTFSLAARPTWRGLFLYTAAIERVGRNGRANGLLSLVHLPRFFVRLIFLFFCRYYSPICNGIAMVRSRDGLAGCCSVK